MGESSKIEWTDATWNPVTGCSVVSPGCTNCYAMRLAGGRLRDHPSRAGLTQPSKAGPVWTGEIRFNEQWLDQPLRWRRPRQIFVCAHGDLFHEDVPDEWIDRIFAIMALAPQHTFQVLTKRPERIQAYGAHPDRAYFVGQQAAKILNRPAFGLDWPLPNVWLGTSVEDQRRADERIPHLLATAAAVRFVSAEPLLGSIYFGPTGPLGQPPGPSDDPWLRDPWPQSPQANRGKLDWIIVGGESGAAARPMHPDWVRSIRDQCQAASVPFFFKQWGEWGPVVSTGDDPDPQGRSVMALPDGTLTDTEWNGGPGPHLIDAQPMYRVGKKAAGRALNGRTWNEYPDG
ncbi:MAG TPA: phage Gp37/Gp68 family protein [Aurantimonas coralicida]|uniref:Phage Gp37/Gp68 family protein n=2 Tax=root TaxID=1 RepID=A0A9C9TG10_9HYPH|nr:phage Gp37/Gp68 family protein [Aurantimonas coralicida]HET99643.1 phage Gp37/Gp68 family protein [Aurantimonas coralicida]